MVEKEKQKKKKLNCFENEIVNELKLL